MNTLPITVNVHHDWLDYLAAVGGLVGGLAALVALVFAGVSRRDAARSAEAAEQTQQLADEQVTILRREAQAADEERAKRAAPEIELGVVPTFVNDRGPPRTMVLSVGFSNDNGTRPVERLTVNLRVPDTFQLRPVGDRYGNGKGTGVIADARSARIGDHVGVLFWNDTLGPIDQHVHPVRYLEIGLAPAGTHTIEAVLANPDLPGGQSYHAWMLIVPGAGDGVTLKPAAIRSGADSPE